MHLHMKLLNKKFLSSSIFSFKTQVTKHVTKLKGKLPLPESHNGTLPTSNQVARQTPERITTLTKNLYFFPGFPPQDMFQINE